ncbi:MAG: hypothetical protein D9C04_03890 [Nitrosopumilus sp. B06]|nr:MAG: hypothetical protein D9C04_03890 [Nitrosopumilus sp. B06]
MSRPQKPDPDEPVVPGSNHTPALAFVAILDMVRAAVKAWMSLKGFTYSPKSGLVFDVDYLHEGLALFIELIRGNRDFRVELPIYLVAITHHASTEADDVLKRGYETISRSSNQPLFGYWKDPAGRPYLDAVVPLQFISKEDAIGAGKRYGQRFILAIWPDGSYEHLKAD